MQDGTNLPARILGIEIIKQISERSEITVAFFRIHTVIDSDEPDIPRWKYDFNVLSNLQIVPSKPAHIFYNDRSNPSFIHKGEHLLHRGPVEIRAGIAVIHKETDIPEAVVISILLQHAALILDGIRLAFEVIFVT